MTAHTVVETPIGRLTIVGDETGISAVLFENEKKSRQRPIGRRDDTLLTAAASQFAEYFAGRRTQFELTLNPAGNAFQHRVWSLLRDIPYGETRSYGQLATQLGDPNLARAVGAANGQNPLAIVVPCHRVIGANGKLTGYAGGLDRKAFLLELESGDPAQAGKLF